MAKPLIDLERPDVELHELGTMLKTIYLDHPDVKDYSKLAKLISDHFNVNCTENDIMGYYEIYDLQEYFQNEDYELEERRHAMGHYY